MSRKSARAQDSPAPRAKGRKEGRRQAPLAPQAPPPPQVFISHMALEEELARAFAEWIKRAYAAGTIEVFVSSLIPPGKNWLKELEEALASSQLFLVLCSRVSVCSPWVLYEVGAGSGKGVLILPVCHGGLAPGNIPEPLGFFESMSLADSKFTVELLDSISKTTGLRVLPGTDHASMHASLSQAAGDVEVKVGTLSAIAAEPKFAWRSVLRLAEKVGTTEVAMKQHLQFLEDKDYVRPGNLLRGGKGYSLTPRGHRLLSCL